MFILFVIMKGDSLREKVTLGSVIFFVGLLSVAVLLAETMSKDWIVNRQLSSIRIMSQYELIPAFIFFVGIAVLGIGIVIWGCLKRKNRLSILNEQGRKSPRLHITNKLRRAGFSNFKKIGEQGEGNEMEIAGIDNIVCKEGI